jgi:hypothetical protein
LRRASAEEQDSFLLTLGKNVERRLERNRIAFSLVTFYWRSKRK